MSERYRIDGFKGKLGSVGFGTVLHLRLRESISSFGSKPQMPVSAILIQPVRLRGAIVLPLGTELRGNLTRVRRVGWGFARETALIALDLNELRVPGGEWRSVATKISAVDNSRERVDAMGQIHGIRATESASKVMSRAAVSLASFDPMALLFGLSASMSAFRIPESEIFLPTGTEFQAVTETPVGVDTTFPEPPSVTSNPWELSELARQLPWRMVTAAKHQLSDVTSILFVGDEDSLLRALHAAGWSRSDTLNAESSFSTMRAVIENQGYREGPVSAMLLGGRAPVGAWSKTLDTFSARHHLRVFAEEKEFDGERVFVSSATHDSGIGINKASRSLIHLIDEDIDAERDKVVADMLLTGCVMGVQYVGRPWLPVDPNALQNATGDRLRTDRRMAVVRLNSCMDAVRSDEPDVELKEVREKPLAAERVVRDAVLYLRDDLYRGNVAYQGYCAAKVTWKYLRPKGDAGKGAQPKVLMAGGEPYTIVSRAKVLQVQTDDFHMSGETEPSANSPEAPKSYKTHVEYSVSGGYSWFNNRFFSEQPFTAFDSRHAEVLGATFNQALHAGYVVAPKATISAWRYFSSEFGYTYNEAPLTVRTNYEKPALPAGRKFDDGQIRQFTYNTIFHARPNGARWRPYAAVGPTFQLLRLHDSKSSKNPLMSLGAKDIGLVMEAYSLGHKPPLDGGAIFQLGLQFGGGLKYQVTPRFFIRSDFRETVSPQPDYWSKSVASLRQMYAAPGPAVNGAKFVMGNERLGSALFQGNVTTGVGFSF